MPTPLDRLDPERRARLVRAAADEFASAGLDGASLNRIIRACGMSKSSFYHLFDAKQDLVDLVIGDLTDQVRSGLDVPAPESFAENFWEGVEEFLSRLERDLVAHPDALLLGRLFYAAPPQGAQAGVVADIAHWVAGVLQVGREVGAVRTDMPDDLQRGLVVAVLRTMDEWVLNSCRVRDPVGPAELAHLLYRMLVP